MKTLNRRQFISLSAISMGAAALAACGGSAPAPTSAPAAKPAAGPVTLNIGSKGDTLEFDTTALEAAAGSKITLNFKNNASASSGLLHNWVLVKSGTDTTVATDGIAAGESKGYVKDGDPNVLLKSKLLKPGESETLTFDAPAAGKYTYICTFPGHNVLMKGTLTIK